MKRFFPGVWPGVVMLVLLVTGVSFARSLPRSQSDHDQNDHATQAPAYCAANHTIGKLVLSVTNYGVFAAEGDALISEVDCYTGAAILACEYPKRSGSQYTYQGSFWIGAVVGRDTLVSVGSDGWQRAREMFPDAPPFGNMIRRSIINPNSSEYEGAVSEQDFIAVYTDTYTSGAHELKPDYTGRPHQPLNIEVTQRSFAWSYPYAEDFVLFDYSIANIGNEELTKVYMGIYLDADIAPSGSQVDSLFQDDVCGFLESIDVVEGRGECTFRDTVNIAWIADNDGDLWASGLQGMQLPNIVATRIVRTPSTELEVSFNWWISYGDPNYDFGPQTIEKYRNFGTSGTGTPEGDANKYHVLRNREFDYDQIYTASIQPTDPVWLAPPQSLALDFADGYDTRYLLSFGPFSIDPGQQLPISFAVVAGENLHYDPDNVPNNIRNNYDPDRYYQNLDFSDLALNSRWASWVYDNPGYVSEGGDTNYAGKYWVCCLDTVGFTVDDSVDPPETTWTYEQCDTIYYEGDGIPDFRGASPPPAPFVWLEPQVGRLTVRFNGQRSENTRDVFSREIDFEGYRVYLARDDRETSYSLVASYDIEDFNKFIYDPADNEWQLVDNPFTLPLLDSLYGDGSGTWRPEPFTRTSPYIMPGFPDSVFAFAPQDFNRSLPGVTSDIAKRYPTAPKPPTLDPEAIPEDERDLYLTDDGFFKYYEYEVAIENLLPTVPYFVNATAFDFGSPSSGLPSLETSRTVDAKSAYALPSASEVAEQDLQVYVWPNPYRSDGDYLERGFEGRFSRYAEPIPDRERRVHFANLPPRCTIRIYTLDGDLVREKEHDVDASDPMSPQDEWDLISRNTQMVVSGIYYWIVEEPDGSTQMGKLIIIM